MERALVVADDYTGAMDTGQRFAANGRSVRVVLSGPDSSGLERRDSSDPDVLVVDANTRAADSETAGDTVSRLLSDAPSLVYKKVDSTLRGNVVSEVDAALAALGADLAVVAPAFPATGRVTVNDRLLVDGVSLADAGYGVQSSTLESRFATSQYDCESLPIDTVVSGRDAIRSALESTLGGEPTLVTCDAIHERHLESIGAAAQSLEATVLFVGSGGLASALSVPGMDTMAAPAVDRPAGDVLGVVGSINDRTLEQLAAVPDNRVVRLAPTDAVSDPLRAGQNAARPLQERLEAHGEAVVTGALEPGDVEQAREGAAALDRDIGPGSRIESALASAAAETAKSTFLSGLFLTGGSVARATLERLNATAIDLSGGAVDDGIPVGHLVDGDLAGATVITKAGGFGSPGSIVNCLSALDEAND